MCGIAGMVGFYAGKNPVELMITSLTHRGPDDRGIWADPSGEAVLGHTRLSIIDLSPAGHQPMNYGNGRYCITFNGEIYNYRELRKELEEWGAIFASKTDTEVVLTSYARWGIDCLQRFRGMFAFGIWDSHEKQLFLARDRMGIKPVLYAIKNGSFIFASEMKAILASGLIEPIINPQALLDYFTTGSVCQPRSFIKNVYFLPAGHFLIYKFGADPKLQRYWNMADHVRDLQYNYRKVDYAELVAITRDKLEEATRYHLVADVPVGSFLSGGTDSSAITALMARYSGYPIKSFSIGFERNAEVGDELGYAHKAASHIGCDHTEIVLDGETVANAFDDLIAALDQPSIDGTNTFFVSQAASRHVKVTLAGIGGDELFAGYPHFRTILEAGTKSAGVLDVCARVLHSLRPNRCTLKRTLRCYPPAGRLAMFRCLMSDKQLKAAIGAPLQKAFSPGFFEDYLGNLADDSFAPIAQISLMEVQNYLCNTLLRDNDAVSMAHSLEVRPVLLDHQLVIHALALPDDAKLRQGVFKAALAEAARDLLPPETLTRHKMGFELPLGTWLRTTLRNRLLTALEDEWLQNIFRGRFLRWLSRQVDNQSQKRLLWAMLILVSWARKYECTLEQ